MCPATPSQHPLRDLKDLLPIRVSHPPLVVRSFACSCARSCHSLRLLQDFSIIGGLGPLLWPSTLLGQPLWARLLLWSRPSCWGGTPTGHIRRVVPSWAMMPRDSQLSRGILNAADPVCNERLPAMQLTINPLQGSHRITPGMNSKNHSRHEQH